MTNEHRTDTANCSTLNWYLGRLDTSIYQCISGKMVTDKVTVTGNRLQHIMERHPDAYDVIVSEMRETIMNPDYILQDRKHESTGLIIRRVRGEQDNLMVVLRICTDINQEMNANSIISGWQISNKRLERYLRTETVLYRHSET